MPQIPFVKLTPAQLQPSAIVPQALDNQWAPSRILRTLIRRGISLAEWQKSKESKRLVLSEWRRALIYTPQVIVNRAALFNNSIVVNDYSGQDKPHFQTLLARRVIVDYLLTEEAPDQRPSFDVSDEKWARWLDAIRDAELACVRLDWGSQDDDFRNVASVFHEYIQTLNMPDRIEHLIGALQIPKSRREAFRQRLIEVARYAFDVAAQGKTVVRNELYKKFVCRDGSEIDKGYYDPEKPFAAELKEIFDLRYTVNLPDALGRYAFTPKGSPDRTMLGDVNQSTLENCLRDNQIEDLIQTIKRMHFALINEGLYLRGLHLLSLGDVVEIRQTDEWEKYIASLNELLSRPLAFESHVDRLVDDFAALNRRITQMKIQKSNASATAFAARWQPWMSIVLAVGSAWMKFSLDSADPSRVLVETLSAPVAVGFAPVALNLKIAATKRVDLGISINFLRNKVNHGREVWREIKGALESDARFKFVEEATSEKEADQSKNEFDPNQVI